RPRLRYTASTDLNPQPRTRLHSRNRLPTGRMKRARAAQINLHPTRKDPRMPFRYFMKPNPSSPTHPFTTRPDPQPAMTEAQFLSAIAGRVAGRTPEQVGAIFDAMRDVLREATRDTIPVESIRGFFRIQPTSGGVFDAPDSPVTAISAGVSYSIILT